jgi:hypothetical protein
VPQLLQSMFELMDEIENEDLVGCLETLVDTFPEEVAPLSVPCAQQLATVRPAVFPRTSRFSFS